MTARVLVEDLRVRRGRTEVLSGVDLAVERGEVLAVLGPNGAGKSTLLGAIGGLLPSSGGSVALDGRVATVLQDPGMARRTAQGNVDLALSWWGVPRDQRAARADAALRAMGADHLATRRATELSGGEKRRVHLARAVAVRPDVLLLDEPFAGLDAASHAALLEDAAPALRIETGAVVLVVHDHRDAWALADRLAVLLDGRIVASGSPQQLLDAPPSAAVARFLGYDGELVRGDRLTLTRPGQVRLDPTGDLEGVIASVVPVLDGSRISVRTHDGTVRTTGPVGAQVGDRVRLKLTGGAVFDADHGRPPRV